MRFVGANPPRLPRFLGLLRNIKSVSIGIIHFSVLETLRSLRPLRLDRAESTGIDISLNRVISFPFNSELDRIECCRYRRVRRHQSSTWEHEKSPSDAPYNELPSPTIS